MRNTCRRKPKPKETKIQGDEKKEERLLPIKISLRGTYPVITKAPVSVENSTYSGKVQKTENNVSGTKEKDELLSIADQVKLRKRGQNILSRAEIFQSFSKSEVPKLQRRRKSYSSSSPLSSPSSVEACSTMSHTDCDKSLVPSFGHLPLISKHIGDTSCDLPVKKAKLSKNLIEKNPLSEDLLDINKHEVALYEEVSSTEPGFPPEWYGLKDMIEVPAIYVSQEEISTCSSNEEKHQKQISELNAEKMRIDEEKKQIEEIKQRLQAEAGLTLGYLELPLSLNESSIQDLDIKLSELESLQTCPVEKNSCHEKELSMARERTDGYVRDMLNIAYEIESDNKKNASKENSLVILDNRAFEPSAVKHSSRARPSQNIISVENKIDSTTTSTKQFSSSPAGSALTSKNHARDYRNNHDNKGVFRPENHAAKEKRKAMDERCIVYVGNIPHGYSDLRLKERFRRFGTIKDIQIKSKVRCDFNSSGGHSLDSEEKRKYGFITFSSNQEATDAIEKGNDGYHLKFQLSFGARRQFVGEDYKDLDGIVAKNENSSYKRNSRSSFLPQSKEDDYSAILMGYMQERGVKPHPFPRMQCHA